MGAWTGKTCVGCDRKKGPAHADKKYCYRCTAAIRRTSRELAHRRVVALRYGLAPGDYDALYDGQARRCAICQRATGATRRLAVDHSHVTGAVRGLLCRPCNDMLGHGRDDPMMFARAMAYLLIPPAPGILGYQPVAESRSTARSGGRI